MSFIINRTISNTIHCRRDGQ